MKEEMVKLPFPEVQLLVERGARRICYILEQREPWNDIDDPEVRNIIKSMEVIFEHLDKWRGK
jgi:hypothetical protein